MARSVAVSTKPGDRRALNGRWVYILLQTAAVGVAVVRFRHGFTGAVPMEE